MKFITPNKAFAHLDRLAEWQRGGKPAPVTIEWDLSNRCPLGCFACHFAHTHVKGPWVTRARRLPMAFDGSGDLADMETVRRGLTDMAAAGVRGIVWSGGGEPTSHPSWLDATLHAAACGLEQGMYTAGVLLRPESAAVLSRLATWVVVSLDADDADTYRQEKQTDGFTAACAGIRALVEAGGTAAIGVSFLLHAGNWNRADSMLALGRLLGASYVTFRPTIETHPDRPDVCAVDRSWITDALPLLDALAEEDDVECDPSRFIAYRDWQARNYATCYGIRLNATVTPDGRVWVCPQRRGVLGSEVGNLTTESFTELWARHVGEWSDFSECRVMCRLHLVNEQIAPLFAARQHEAFV